jgi:hypothetical protein
MPGSGVKDLKRACSLNDLVLRHVLVNHPQVLFDAMVQAISGEWHPQEGVAHAEEERPRGRDRDRDRDRGREGEAEEIPDAIE